MLQGFLLEEILGIFSIVNKRRVVPVPNGYCIGEGYDPNYL